MLSNLYTLCRVGVANVLFPLVLLNILEII